MKQALRVAFGFLMLWAAVLHAEVRIEITQVDSARPIGVVPFQWAGQWRCAGRCRWYRGS